MGLYEYAILMGLVFKMKAGIKQMIINIENEMESILTSAVI